MNDDETVTANFERIQHTLTMAVSPSGGGTTTPPVGDHDYDAGTVVNITAAPAAGYEFVDWTGDVANPTSASTTVTMDDDKTVTANFERITSAIELVKMADPTVIYSGDTVNYTYRITNTGIVILTNVSLSDDRLGDIDLSPTRVISDLLALYTFEEGDGTTVHDVSGVGAPLDLTVEDETAVGWIPSGGLSINSSTIVASVVTATKIIETCKGSDEISIEAWIKPANTTLGGPARIVTLSDGAYDRNFTLAQQASAYNTRLRTTETNGNGIPSLTAGAVTTGEASHIVYTRDASGVARLYVNGVEVGSRDDISGDFSNWDEGFRFGLANEFGAARAWLGELHLVAIYSRALSQADVIQNFEARAGIVLSPGESITATVSTTLDEDTTNTATTTGTDSAGGSVSDTDMATVDVINPDIAIEKTANPATIYTGDTVTYTYEVTNPGDDALSAVTVSDDRCSPVTFVGGDTDGDELLDVGETWTYRCSTTLDEDTTNTATATGTDSAGGTVSAQDTAFVAVISPVPTEYFVYLPFISHNHVVALDLAVEHSKGHKR
jgi:uncharacterized repeat protein (TIGR01451 family)/uncharacterized repeat protein (TIGR02543 family)